MKIFKRSKRFHIGKYEIYLLGMMLFALTLRLVLIAFHWPATNSDEGTMGVLALHIAYKGEWPIFFYGQFYMGTIEGYVAALLFHVFGPSLSVLRLSLLPFYAMFLLCMYGLTSLLQTKKFALFIALLFSFSASGIIFLQLRAIGGYPEIQAFAAAICLMVIWLALSMPSGTSTRRVKLLRIGVYGCLGLVGGLAVWVDLLILPFIGMGILFLLLFCRREVFSLLGLILVAGFIISLLPLIIYNVHVPYDQSSLYVLLVLHNGNAGADRRFLVHLVGAFGIGLPAILGYGMGCPQSAFPFFGRVDLPCVLLETSWGVGYLILCAVVVITALFALWKLWRSQKGASLFSFPLTWEQRQIAVRECGRLMVLICALGTFILYLTSPSAALAPGTSFRYLVCMIISVPTALWPLWSNIRSRAFATWKKTLSTIVKISLLALVLFMSIYGPYHIFADEISDAQSIYQIQIDLSQHLMSMHVKYVYSEYWTCDKLTFISDENVICSVLDDNLHPGVNRYTPYQTMVEAAPHPAYVFPDTSAQAHSFEQDIAHKKFAIIYQRTLFDGYVIYTPQTSH